MYGDPVKHLKSCRFKEEDEETEVETFDRGHLGLIP